MHHPGAHASPNGVLYHNGAAAVGFGIGTPYQPQLPTYQYNGSMWQYPTATPLPQSVAGYASVPHAIYAYRGSHWDMMSYDAQWDDARLLQEMRKTYDRLRSWRKWLSLKNVRSITLVSVSRLVD